MEENTATIGDQGVTAYLENMRLMNDIIREMKEIPELPSEVPRDQSSLEKVEFPPEGGVLTYMSNHTHPYRGFPFFEFVEKIDVIKKVSRASISGFYHAVKRRSPLVLITLIPTMWMFKDVFYAMVYTFYRIVERFRVKPIRYSKAVREMYRAFSVYREGEKERTYELRTMMRDLCCMLMEFDNAYRFRAQDLIPEIDPVRIKTHTVQELKRIFDIAITRETTQEVKDTWKLCKMVVGWFLRFDGELKRMCGDVLSQLNATEAGLTPEDRHYCEKRTDYTFAP